MLRSPDRIRGTGKHSLWVPPGSTDARRAKGKQNPSLQRNSQNDHGDAQDRRGEGGPAGAPEAEVTQECRGSRGRGDPGSPGVPADRRQGGLCPRSQLTTAPHPGTAMERRPRRNRGGERAAGAARAGGTVVPPGPRPTPRPPRPPAPCSPAAPPDARNSGLTPPTRRLGASLTDIPARNFKVNIKRK